MKLLNCKYRNKGKKETFEKFLIKQIIGTKRENLAEMKNTKTGFDKMKRNEKRGNE